MSQVMFDKAILYENQIFTVNQTWDGDTPVIEIFPENEKLKNHIESILKSSGQLTLYVKGSCFEIRQSQMANHRLQLIDDAHVMIWLSVWSLLPRAAGN